MQVEWLPGSLLSRPIRACARHAALQDRVRGKDRPLARARAREGAVFATPRWHFRLELRGVRNLPGIAVQPSSANHRDGENPNRSGRGRLFAPWKGLVLVWIPTIETANPLNEFAQHVIRHPWLLSKLKYPSK